MLDVDLFLLNILKLFFNDLKWFFDGVFCVVNDVFDSGVLVVCVVDVELCVVVVEYELRCVWEDL